MFSGIYKRNLVVSAFVLSHNFDANYAHKAFYKTRDVTEKILNFENQKLEVEEENYRK